MVSETSGRRECTYITDTDLFFNGPTIYHCAFNNQRKRASRKHGDTACSFYDQSIQRFLFSNDSWINEARVYPFNDNFSSNVCSFLSKGRKNFNDTIAIQEKKGCAKKKCTVRLYARKNEFSRIQLFSRV